MAAHEFLLPADAMDVGQPSDHDLDVYFDAVTNPDAASETNDAAGRVQRWQPVDDHGAEWAMRKLAAAAAELGDLEAERDRLVDEIRGWFDRRSRKTRSSVDHWTALLTRYALDQRDETDRATVDLPSGKITTRDMRDTPKIEIIDPEAVARWAPTGLPDEAVETVVPPQPPKVLVSKLAPLVKVLDDGQVVGPLGDPVPGVTVTYGDLTATVKPR